MIFFPTGLQRAVTMMLPQTAANAFCSAQSIKLPDLGEKGVALLGGMSERTGRQLMVKIR
jgi:hypothetical protein